MIQIQKFKNDSILRVIRILQIKIYLLSLMLLLSSFPNSIYAQSIPAPEDVFGFKVGADFKLATYDQSIAYFNKLDEASELIEMKYAGKTSEGKDWYFAVISSKENIENLSRYKEISQALAHPDNLTKEESKKLVKEGKPIVHIDGGLHASEVGGAQHTISLAHYLISNSEDEKVKRILNDVILILWPSLNPD
jgi:murein tripeptide amidase MpaA